jgi:hypothetical protein
MEAMIAQNPAVHFEIFTLVPQWFFQDSLTGTFGYHPVLTDVGLVQKNSLEEDLPETVQRLDNFLPFTPDRLEKLAEQVRRLECRLVVCDIAPLGIAVAHQAGLPAILIENFTWDWIYEGYALEEQGLNRHIAYLRDVFRTADYHIQAEPVCDRRAADLMTPPISRKLRTPAEALRVRLSIPEQDKAVLLTMGGVPWQYTFLEQLAGRNDVHFIIPGAAEQWERWQNLLLLPHQSGIFHPDLVNTSDVVIGKAGYSTLAETYQAGIPFGYISRPKFRESLILADYIKQEMNGFAISEADFREGEWLDHLSDLLALPRLTRHNNGGADLAASFIWDRLHE